MDQHRKSAKLFYAEDYFRIAGIPEITEFQGHVEPRELMLPVELDGRYVVDSVLALFDDALNLREPDISTVIFFPRGACKEAQIGDRKHYRVENRLIPFVEGTIHENVIFGINHEMAVGPRLAGHE